MTITFNCPECEAPLKADDDMAGKTGKCPECQKQVNVPPRTDESAAAT